MKVLMLTPSYDPIIGGTETVVKDLAIHLNKIGVEIGVMTFNMDKKWEPRWRWEVREENGFKVYRIPAFNPFTKIPNPMALFFKMNVISNPSFRKIAKEYDILHFHDDVDLTFPLFSYFINKPKIFYCHTLHATHSYYRKKLGSAIFKKIFNLYMGGCKSTSSLLLDLDIPNNKVKTVYYGVDIEKYKPNENEKVDNLILFAGRPEPRKGLHVLLQSLQYLNTPIKLVILGFEINTRYSNQIKEMIDKEKKRRVHDIMYITTVHGDGLIPWYQKAAIFVCPSILDVFPTVNPQALACGTPIIGTNVGGIPEIVIDEVTGLLVPSNDPVELASAIQRLLEDKDLRDRCGKEGRALVEQSFSWSAIAKGLCEIYEEMISSK